MTVFLDLAVCAIIVNEGKVLIMRRSKAKRHLSGAWDFPCERVKDGSLEDNIKRGVYEEAGISVEVLKRANPITLEDGDWKYVLIPFLCKTESRNVKMDEEHDDFRWVALEEMVNFEMIHYADDALRLLGVKR